MRDPSKTFTMTFDDGLGEDPLDDVVRSFVDKALRVFKGREGTKKIISLGDTGKKRIVSGKEVGNMFNYMSILGGIAMIAYLIQFKAYGSPEPEFRTAICV